METERISSKLFQSSRDYSDPELPAPFPLWAETSFPILKRWRSNPIFCAFHSHYHRHKKIFVFQVTTGITIAIALAVVFFYPVPIGCGFMLMLLTLGILGFFKFTHLYRDTSTPRSLNELFQRRNNQRFLEDLSQLPISSLIIAEALIFEKMREWKKHTAVMVTLVVIVYQTFLTAIHGYSFWIPVILGCFAFMIWQLRTYFFANSLWHILDVINHDLGQITYIGIVGLSVIKLFMFLLKWSLLYLIPYLFFEILFLELSVFFPENYRETIYGILLFPTIDLLIIGFYTMIAYFFLRPSERFKEEFNFDLNTLIVTMMNFVQAEMERKLDR